MPTSEATSTPRKPLFGSFPPTPTEDWEARIREDLKGRDYEETLLWHPEPELPLRPYYRREDLPKPPLPTPGRAKSDVVRVVPLMGPSVEDANDIAITAIDRGATALRLSITRRGSRWTGLPLFRPSDAIALFKDVNFTETTLHLEAIDADGQTLPALLALVLEGLERRAPAANSFRGLLCMDPWASALKLGRLHLAPFMDSLAEVIRYTSEHLPKARALGIDAQIYHEGGAMTSRELACTLAAISETLAQLSERGIDPVVAARQLHITVPVGSSYLLEIAKLRALRHLVPQVLRAYGAGAASLPAMPLRAVTSRRMLTRYDAHMNMVRATTAAASAIIGGADALEIRPFDEAAGGPSPFGRRIAQNTALILELEARLHHVMDPAAGSYYIETLTDKLAERAWARFQEIEDEGGLYEAVHTGRLQQDIGNDRERLVTALAKRERILIGINHYPDPKQQPSFEKAPGVTELPPAKTEQSSSTLSELRIALRNGAVLSELLSATTSEPLLTGPLDCSRLAEPFEALRAATDRHAEATGNRPTAFLLPVGPPAVRSARASFARNLLGCAGFEIIERASFDSLEDGLAALRDATPEMVVLCISDEHLEEYLSRTTDALKDSNTSPLLLVTAPPEEHLDVHGADLFLYQGVNVLTTLQQLQKWLGIGTG